MLVEVLASVLCVTAPLLVTPGELRRQSAKAVIVDARDEQSFEAGHLPGAISLPWVDLAKMPQSPRAKPPYEMAQLLTSRGIPSHGWVVVYGMGAEGFGEEGRLFWSLNYLGQRQVSVLDGGVPAWRRAGLNLTTEAALKPAAKFVEEVNPAVRVEKAALAQEAGRGAVVLLDVRDPDEFKGARKYNEPRGGHLPGAINVPWKSFLAADGTLLPEARIEALLKERGVAPERPVVVYCTGGVRSGFAFFALKVAGVKTVANYDGSFWEWAADSSLPLDGP